MKTLLSRQCVLVLLSLLLSSLTSLVGGFEVALDCDPCIDRESYRIKAIVHGTKTDGFWHQVRNAAIQAGKDMRVDLEFELYDTYSDEQMAKDISQAAALAAADDPEAPDVLIVTIPSAQVEEAIEDALEDIPIFGMNSGYDRAAEIGILGFVAMDEYVGGHSAAKEFLSKTNVTKALFINHAKGNTALEARFSGFSDALNEHAVQVSNGTKLIEVDELVVDTDDDPLTPIEAALEGCPYDAILVGGFPSFESTASALESNGCDVSKTLVGAIDTGSTVLDAIAVGRVDFAISQQQYLQGALSVVLASVYATTGKTISRSSESEFGIYFSGPKIVSLRNLPSDTERICEVEAFPVCDKGFGSSMGELELLDTATSSLSNKCPCTDRSKIRIGGVLHGVTIDPFWDIVFEQAEQAADDLGVDLILDRLEPQPTTEVWHAKMASKILSLCQEGVDGVFVTIPGDGVKAAIQECQTLNVPVLSINTGAIAAKELGLVHHISQLEYPAGLAAGRRLVEGGIKEAFCVTYEAGNTAFEERCQGLEDAAAEAPDVTYRGRLLVRRDNELNAIKAIEDGVGRDGDWAGVGFLAGGQDPAEAIVALKELHPKFVAGIFDLSSTIYDGLDDGVFLFSIDQNPFVQGYMPVWLLTLMASTQQNLVNTFIESGPRFVEKSPSEALQQCADNNFKVCSRPFEIVYDDNLLDSGILAFGYVAVSVSWALSLFFLGWIAYSRELNIVKASQPGFLVLICVGAIISSSTLVSLSFQAASNEDTTKASTGCTVAPFLYAIGWVLIFSSLCAKTFRLFKIMKNCANKKQEVVSFISMLKIVVFALIVDMAIVIAWTVVNPLVYKREELSRDIDNETGVITITSIGYCTSRDEDGPGLRMFAGPLASFHLILMMITIVLLYKVRKITDRYQESKYIGFAMLLMLETLAVGIPIAVAVGDPHAVYVVLTGIIAVHDIGVLSLLFFPKILFQSSAQDDEKYRKEDSVLLASLNKVSKSRFGEAMEHLDEMLMRDESTKNALTERERSTLRLVKTLLIQRNEDHSMHVPSHLFANPRSNSYILKEFGGVTRFDRGDARSVSSRTVSEQHHSDEFDTLPEFHTLLDDEQRKSLLPLLSWSNLKRWDFSIFDVLKVTGGHPLLFVGWAILGAPHAQYSMAKACGQEDASIEDFEGYDFIDSKLKIPIKKLCDYLRVIESGYEDENPYHNATHAADVVQSLHSLIQMKADEFTDTEELFSILLAAAVHDVKHPGKNNSFQVNAKTNVALVYNDASVLENKHAAYAFMLMLGSDPDKPGEEGDRNNDLNILANVKRDKFASIRKRVVEAVLKTDMSRHFAEVDAIRSLLEHSGADSLDAAARWKVLSYMLHIADISNQAKDDPLFQVWADLCFDEFFDQGDMEEKMGLPVSPNCDRKTTKIPAAEVGFVNFVIKPSFEVLGLAVPAVREEILPLIEKNLEYWKHEAETKN